MAGKSSHDFETMKLAGDFPASLFGLPQLIGPWDQLPLACDMDRMAWDRT